MQKILIIEDEQAISHVLKAYLSKLYEVVQVFDVKVALECFFDVQPELVLLDVMLPHKDGWVILGEIREHSKCPVIMLTALGIRTLSKLMTKSLSGDLQLIKSDEHGSSFELSLSIYSLNTCMLTLNLLNNSAALSLKIATYNLNQPLESGVLL